jgi:hypothetical protein
MWDTCPAHHILLDLIIQIMSGEEYMLWSPSLCRFLQPPIISSLIRSLFQQLIKLTKLRDSSPQATYTDRATAACRQS